MLPVSSVSLHTLGKGSHSCTVRFQGAPYLRLTPYTGVQKGAPTLRNFCYMFLVDQKYFGNETVWEFLFHRAVPSIACHLFLSKGYSFQIQGLRPQPPSSSGNNSTLISPKEQSPP